MEDEPFDQEAFEEYLNLVLQCTKVSADSTSDDVKTEAPSMIRKMRGLIHPAIKHEVDFAEATKDGSNILAHWAKGDAAGRAAFIQCCPFLHHHALRGNPAVLSSSGVWHLNHKSDLTPHY